MTLKRDCSRFATEGWQFVSASASGFPPNTTFTTQTLKFVEAGGFTMILTGHGIITDADGNWPRDGFPELSFGSPNPFTATHTVVWAGGTLTTSLYVDCTQPATQEDCKDGGYKEFDFENQGQCVAFVERGAKH